MKRYVIVIKTVRNVSHGEEMALQKGRDTMATITNLPTYMREGSVEQESGERGVIRLLIDRITFSHRKQEAKVLLLSPAMEQNIREHFQSGDTVEITYYSNNRVKAVIRRE